MIDRDAEPRDLTFAEEITDDVLGDFLPGHDTRPDQCAICGQRMRDIEDPENGRPLSIFPGAAELFTNGDKVEVTEQTRSLLVRFCDEHWAAILEQASDPRKVSLQSIDGEYVGQRAVPDDKRVPRDKPEWRKKWDQTQLRVARGIAYLDSEAMFEREREKREVESALLVAAVDRYGIDYGPVEDRKEALVRTLLKHDVDAKRLLHPSFDLQIQFTESDHEVVGSVFRIPEDTNRFKSQMLSEYEATPERRVTNTRYLNLTHRSYHEEVTEFDEDVQYIGFYWLTEEDRWVWYPLKPTHDTDFYGDDRNYLPVDGPTGSIPAVPLSELSAETTTTEGYERRIEERWNRIEQNRPLYGRLKDVFLRKIRQ